MTKDDVTKLLGVILSVYQNNFSVKGVTVGGWHLALKDEDANAVFSAAAHVLKTSSFPPVPADIVKVIREREKLMLPEPLTWTPEEALDNYGNDSLLIEKAREFANRVTPEIKGDRQYEDETQLARAVEINEREWNKAFKAKFQIYKDKILLLHKQGVAIDIAANRVLNEGKIDIPELIELTKQLCNVPTKIKA